MHERRKRKMDYFSIDFYPETIIRDVRKYLISIMALSLTLGCLAYIVLDMRYQPFYQMTGTYVITDRRYNNNVIQNFDNTQIMVGRYTSVIRSGALKKRISEDTGIPVEQMYVNASQVPETNLISISVQCTHPEDTYRVYHSLLMNYQEFTGRLTGATTMRELVSPAVPMYPTSYSTAKRKAVLILGMALIGLTGIAGGISCLRDTIRRDTDVEQKLETQFLGEVIHEQRGAIRFFMKKKNRISEDDSKKISVKGVKTQKISLLVTRQITSFWYSESVSKTCRRVQNAMARSKAKTLLVTSLLENEGKSTIVANLAITLARQGKKVLLMDMDLLSPAQYKIFDCKSDIPVKLGEVLEDTEKLQSAIGFIPTAGIYTAFNDVRYFKTSVDMLANGNLAEILRTVRENFDYCIIDSPPCGVSLDAETISTYADATLVVVRQHQANSGSINDMLSALDQSGAEVIGCILNDVYKKSIIPTGRYRYEGGYNTFDMGGRNRRK